jgi:hypothetical protein
MSAGALAKAELPYACGAPIPITGPSLDEQKSVIQ